MAEARDNVLDVETLSIALRQDDATVPIVEDISFSLARGEVLALVGESGSGKSLTALSLMQLLSKELAITKGRILLHAADGGVTDIVGLGANGRAIEAIRGRRMGMIFQEPMSSFSPIHTIGAQIAEVAMIHEKVTREEARRRAAELLAKVGIPDPVRALDRYPQEFSGGMRQRAMIARALICGPGLLIADEPTTALDVTIQSQILDLMRKLKNELGMAILFITHDLGIVAQMADRVAIMYSGRIVESGPVRDIFRRPVHPYTRALLEAVPRLGDIDRHRKIRPIAGSIPNIFDVPQGCRFHPRCPAAQLPRCAEAPPPRYDAGRHHVSCIHGAEELGR
ncbi:MAG: ABC transporter ATP-binding protein [Rhodospirillaceae bacterium]|nr:ABC transporter ATP-binding protein [Rhodospirillaceae bacterium]